MSRAFIIPWYCVGFTRRNSGILLLHAISFVTTSESRSIIARASRNAENGRYQTECYYSGDPLLFAAVPVVHLDPLAARSLSHFSRACGNYNDFAKLCAVVLRRIRSACVRARARAWNVHRLSSAYEGRVWIRLVERPRKYRPIVFNVGIDCRRAVRMGL